MKHHTQEHALVTRKGPILPMTATGFRDARSTMHRAAAGAESWRELGAAFVMRTLQGPQRGRRTCIQCSVERRDAAGDAAAIAAFVDPKNHICLNTYNRQQIWQRRLQAKRRNTRHCSKTWNDAYCSAAAAETKTTDSMTGMVLITATAINSWTMHMRNSNPCYFACKPYGKEVIIMAKNTD
jgi:hypothetical protein